MAVENFTGLANSGYYNQMPISRIVEGFCVQTGLGAADTGEGTTTWGQGAFPNEITDALHHYAGALATPTAARAARATSASSILCSAHRTASPARTPAR